MQPDPTPSKPRLDPKQLPLVKVFKLVKRLARNGDLTVAEARAVHEAACELDSVGDFALHILHRIKKRNVKANLDELYSGPRTSVRPRRGSRTRNGASSVCSGWRAARRPQIVTMAALA